MVDEVSEDELGRPRYGMDRFDSEVDESLGKPAKVNSSSTGLKAPVGANSLLGFKWRKNKFVNEGAFGEVWEANAENDEKANPVCIKIELPTAAKSELDQEATKLLDAQGPGIPKFYEYMDNAGIGDKNKILVMQKLGINLEQYRTKCGGKLGEAIVLRLAKQMIDRFRFIHNRKPIEIDGKTIKHEAYVFRDTKPNNFMLGWDPVEKHLTNDVYLIDFGLSSTYWDKGFKCHLPKKGPMGTLAGFVGTQRYASIDALKKYQQTRADDMESLGYVWGHLFTGRLPWAGMQPNTAKYGSDAKAAKCDMLRRQVKKRKLAIANDWTYEKENETINVFPPVIKEYMNKVMSLDKKVHAGHENVMCEGVDFDNNPITRNASSNDGSVCCAEPEYDKYQDMITKYANENGIDLDGGFVKESVDENGKKAWHLKCDS
jgi:serine/threonine protein kinase